MKILIAAGGSGGHIFPAIALKRTLGSRGSCEIKFVGADKAIDRRIFEKEGVAFSLLSANKLPYRMSPAIILFFIGLFLDSVKALWITAAFRPTCCVGFGGYVSFPVMLSAKLLRVPTVVHEQNVVPGRANKILFSLADKVALSFKDTILHIPSDQKNKVSVTGNPIRTGDLKNSDKAAALKSFGLDGAKFTVLVIGGSQGAHVLNENFVRSISHMEERVKAGLQIIHLTGVKDYEWAVAQYSRIFPADSAARAYSFIDRIEDAYSAADLIVTRAGASALFEVAYFGKAMIVVPYPYAMSHQLENAHAFSSRGGAVEIEEKDLSESFFKDTIEGFLKDRSKLEALGQAAKALSAPYASDRLADIVTGGLK
ncbi:MAG: undecaprenyldiphospho-muramoylpentapeptide beta-N-acetylglucosaminyltransferase [Candidatus Omnitrophica bacterium]|nr:undecaprenyldiphospho-muramoylpentapeptide beta-N-acetylglucosaminyltransferase [Candidatus Omnitrophota bacterium]